MKMFSKPWILVSSIYTLLTLLFLLPLISDFRNLAGHGDAWQFVWNFWWIKFVFIHDQSIWYTTMLHWPDGISLLAQTMTLINSAPAVILSNFFGLVSSYNVLVILHYVLSGLAMYALCYHITKHHVASFIGGALFAFSPFRLVHYYGHLHLMTTEVIPFALLFIIKTLEGRRLAWLWAGIACALAAYADWYYFLFLALVSAALALWYLASHPESRSKATFMRLAGVVLLVVVLTAPYLGPFLHFKYTTNELEVYGHDPVIFSSHLKSFLVPGGRSFFNIFTVDTWSKWPGWREDGSYVGWSVLLLLGWGFFKARSKWFWFWGVTGVIFAILSLGPKTMFYGWFVGAIPLFALAGVASRFFVITTVALSILVSLTLAHLISRHRRGMLIAVLFFILLAFEYLPEPVVTSPVVVSPFYRQLATDPERFAIIDISDNHAKVLYYQTIHEKPLVGGYVSRSTVSANRFLEITPVINDLVAGGEKFRSRRPPANGRAMLASMSIKYIVVNQYDEDLLQYIKQLGIPRAYQDEYLAAYQVY